MEEGALIKGKGGRNIFSAREFQILSLIVLGKNNTEIAKELIISVNTVKVHVCAILHKLSVNNRVQAAVKAVRNSLLCALLLEELELCFDLFPCFSTIV